MYVCIHNWPLPIGVLQDQYKQPIQINITRLKIPTGGRNTSWPFTSVAQKLNSELPRTISASGQNGIWTRNLRIKSGALTTRPRCPLKKRLMSFVFEKTSSISLSCVLVPVQYLENEYGLFGQKFFRYIGVFFCRLFMSWPCRTGFVRGFCVEFIWPYPIESYIREYVFFALLCRIWRLPS